VPVTLELICEKGCLLVGGCGYVLVGERCFAYAEEFAVG
jgi:hypothetical protein